MRVFGERADRRGTDSLGWRIGRSQFRVLAFEFLKLAEQPIVLSIRQRRSVEYEVVVRRLFENLTELGGAICDGRGQRSEVRGQSEHRAYALASER